MRSRGLYTNSRGCLGVVRPEYKGATNSLIATSLGWEPIRYLMTLVKMWEEPSNNSWGFSTPTSFVLPKEFLE